MLLLFTGLPGAGKTTLARAYAGAVGARHFNSDLLRRELGLMGHYAEADKARVYEELLRRTRAALTAGDTVVVDGTFFREDLRAPFRTLAREAGVPFRWVEVRAHEETIRQRVGRPRPDSEADFDVYLRIRDAYEPLAEPHLTVWTDEMPVDELVKKINDSLGP